MAIGFSNLGNYGRLGNQMFQYAALRGIAHKNNLHWIIPKQEKFKETYHSTSNMFECFTLNKARSLMFDHNFRYLYHESEYTNKFKEDIFLGCKDDTDLLGYFQSPKYFEEIQDEIKNEYTLIDNEKNIDPDHYISLHVRRGDYIGLGHILPTQNIDYYMNALDRLDKNLHVVVSSDDIDWCKSVFHDDRFIFSTGSPYDDMKIMIQATESILSNSSYAWWGAYLSGNKNVIIPSNWFGPMAPHHSTEEFLMEGWSIC